MPRENGTTSPNFSNPLKRLWRLRITRNNDDGESQLFQMYPDIKEQDNHIRFLIGGSNDLNEFIELQKELKIGIFPSPVYPQAGLEPKEE